MSREKAARLLAMSDVEKAVYRSKRNQRSYWQKLSHENWVAFCKEMAAWFAESAPDEWDEYVKANVARKKADAEAALSRRQ